MSTIKDVYELDSRASTGGIDKGAQAVKQLDRATDDLGSTSKKSAANVVTLNNALDLVGKGLKAAKDFAQAAIGDTLDYAKAVRDLSANIGATITETSKIIQVADDYGISTNEITASLEMMTKRGIAPSIDKLAAMADQFVATEDPVKRAALMTEAFGRGWTTLTPMLKEGGAALRAGALEAERMGLVLSETDTKAARELEVNLDNLNDRMTALKLKVGNALIPVLNDAADGFAVLTDNVKISGDEEDMLKNDVVLATIVFGEQSQQVRDASQALIDYYNLLRKNSLNREAVVAGIVAENDALRLNGKANAWAAAGVRTGGTAMRNAARDVQDLADQMDVLTERRQALRDMGFTDADVQVRKIDDLKIALGDTATLTGRLQEKLLRLADQGFEPNSVQIQNVIRKLGDLRVESEVTAGKFADISPQMEDAFLSAQASLGPYEDKVKDTALAMKELTAQTIYQVASAGLSSSAALTLAEKLGLVDKGAVAAVRAIDAIKKSNQDGKLSNDEYADSVIRIQDAVAGLQDKHITVTVDTIAKEMAQQQREQRAEETGHGVPRFAQGGSMIVPRGFNRDNYLVGVSSDERVDVTPAGKSTGAAGATNLTLNVYGPFGPGYTPAQAGAQAADGYTNQMRARGVKI